MPKKPSPRDILAANLRALLDHHDMKGPQLATKAGIDRKSVNNMLNGRHSPNLDAVEAVAGVFGLSAWQLLRPNFDPEHAPASREIEELLERYYGTTPEHRSAIRHLADLAAHLQRKHP